MKLRSTLNNYNHIHNDDKWGYIILLNINWYIGLYKVKVIIIKNKIIKVNVVKYLKFFKERNLVNYFMN